MQYRLADTEKGGFIGFAGLAKKVEQGAIPKGSNTILMLTGKGYREQFVREQPDFVLTPGIHRPTDIRHGVLTY